MTATQLFAAARGCAPAPGPYRCWYCGGACDETHTAAQWVKGSCTVHQYAAAPASDYVCWGCAAALDERAAVEVHTEGTQSPKRVRLYSWVVTANSAVAHTRRHAGHLREVCLAPPAPPYTIVISSSGQKHLLYLARVVESSDAPSVQLDEEHIDYTVASLQVRLDLTEMVCAATGKPALTERPGFSVYRGLRALDPERGIETADQWARCWSEPLSRLAVWLTPRKEVCLERFSKHT